MRRVLIVDDEPRMAAALNVNLRARHYDVTTAGDGLTALRLAGQQAPDVVLLDLGLPDLPGIEVIHGLRASAPTPIIVLSGRTDVTEKIAAFDAGADDYLTKPFVMEELLARLRAVLRRPPVVDDPVPIGIGGYRVDLAAYTVTPAHGRGEPLHLTPNEWRLLARLVRTPGRVVTSRQLLHDVWGPGFENRSNYLRVYFANLRRKLEPDRAHPRHLITESGIGYRFEP